MIEKRVLILNYHLIDGNAYSFDAFGGIYAVKLDDFKNQMSVLNKLKIPVISLNDIVDNRINEEFSVALTFDDGNPSDYDLVYPILKQFDYTATFFLTINNLEKDGVSWDLYREIKKGGNCVGSHGITHRDFSTLDSRELKIELEQAKDIIERNLGDPVRFLSLPFGTYNAKVIRLAKETGYDAIVTTKFKHVYPSQRPYVIDRWSIKRNTSIRDFNRVLQNNFLTINKFKYASAIKKFFLSVFGSSITNALYTLKNKHLWSL